MRFGLPLLLAAVFGLYARYRQEYIGACDWYGYYQESLLFKSGKLFLETELPATTYPAQIPLGFSYFQGHIVPQYPPGFPLLLALAGSVGLAFFVPALIGLASCLLMYRIVADLTTRRIGALFALLWAFSPIVVWGATNLMSDLAATTCLLAGYYAYRKDRLALATLALGFGIAIRPTNALLLPLWLIPLVRDRRLWRFALWFCVPAAIYGIYNHLVYGAPWRTGYLDISYDLVAEVFPQHLGFYLGQTVAQLTPLVLLLGLLGLRRLRSEAVFYLLWFAVPVLFYCFWRSGGDRWWWTRFILPGLPPLYFLGAAGLHRVPELLAQRLASSSLRRALYAGLTVVLALLPVYYVWFGLNQRDLWTKHKGEDYYQIVRQTEALVPPQSVVGSVEFSGSFRIYTRLGSFLSVHENAPTLVAALLQRHRASYLIVEPWNARDPVVQTLLTRFHGAKVRDFDVWGGVTLYRLSPAAEPSS